MKKILVLYLIVSCTYSFAQSQDPYDRNKPDTSPNGRNGTREKPTNQEGKENDIINTNANANRQKSREVNPGTELAPVVEGLSSMLGILKDEYSAESIVGRFQLGLGLTQLPLIVNTSAYSTTEKIYTGDVSIGLNIGFLKDKAISFDIKGVTTYKLPSIIKGNSGVFSNIGGSLTLFVSPDAESAIKFFTEIGYTKFKGEFKSDGSDGDPFDSQLDFSALRLGCGIKLHIIDYDKESWIKPGFFLEKPSFLTADQRPIASFNLQFNIQNEIEVDFSFSKNYYVAGSALNTNSFINKDQNMFTIKLIRNGKIF
jgi:hypothetical protein